MAAVEELILTTQVQREKMNNVKCPINNEQIKKRKNGQGSKENRSRKNGIN